MQWCSLPAGFDGRDAHGYGVLDWPTSAFFDQGSQVRRAYRNQHVVHHKPCYLPKSGPHRDRECTSPVQQRQHRVCLCVRAPTVSIASALLLRFML